MTPDLLDLSREQLDALRTYAQRFDAETPEHCSDLDRHAYLGSCPWCRADEYRTGGAHEWALALLDEIDRLNHLLRRRPFAPVEAEDLMDTDELAALLGVPRSTLQNYRHTGRAKQSWPWLPEPLRHIQGRPVWDANVVRLLHRQASTI